MLCHNVLDLQQMAEDYAWRYFQDYKSTKGWTKSEHKGLERSDASFDVNFKHLVVQHEDPEYNRLESTTPKPYSLFKTVFTNNTDRAQEYSFKTERSTESVCLICREQGFNIGRQAELSLKTPGEIMELKGGFKHEMSVTKIQENSITETLNWGVDSVISVPPRYQTVAELVVEEMRYSGTFVVRSTVTGRFTVSVIRRRDNYLIMEVAANVVDLLLDFLDHTRGKINSEVRNMVTIDIDNNIVSIKSTGKCSFEFAMKQKVLLNEEGTRKDTGTQTDKRFID